MALLRAKTLMHDLFTKFVALYPWNMHIDREEATYSGRAVSVMSPCCCLNCNVYLLRQPGENQGWVVMHGQSSSSSMLSFSFARTCSTSLQQRYSFTVGIIMQCPQLHLKSQFVVMNTPRDTLGYSLYINKLWSDLIVHLCTLARICSVYTLV